MNPDNREDFLWLMSEEAIPLLEKVQTAFEERVNAVRIAKSVRKRTTPTRSALIMEQAQLRIRGSRKFKLANQMFFTRRGFEQATGRRLAAYKAARFSELDRVADVCCGIGGDLISLGQRDEVAGSGFQTIAVDSDELTCLFARKNLAVNSLDPELVQIQQLDFEKFDLSGINGIHIDPDRRLKERTVQGNRFSPSLVDVYQRIDPHCSVAVKVAPATPVASYFPKHMQREWIGDHRECKQQVLWSGPATDKPGHRTATYVGKGGVVSQISVEESELDQKPIVFDSIRRFIFDPHPTVLAANLADAIARKNGLGRFTSSIVYLTGDEPVSDPLLPQFEVIDILPLDLRKTIKVLGILDVGEVEIKKRGVENVTAAQFARMKLDGANKATVILTRLGRTRVAVIAKRKGNDLAFPVRKTGESDNDHREG
ncbi:MAG: hypothetical protein AB8B55_07445 [Mariniblastus sp.]